MQPEKTCCQRKKPPEYQSCRCSALSLDSTGALVARVTRVTRDARTHARTHVDSSNAALVPGRGRSRGSSAYSLDVGWIFGNQERGCEVCLQTLLCSVNAESAIPNESLVFVPSDDSTGLQSAARTLGARCDRALASSTMLFGGRTVSWRLFERRFSGRVLLEQRCSLASRRVPDWSPGRCTSGTSSEPRFKRGTEELALFLHLETFGGCLQ